MDEPALNANEYGVGSHSYSSYSTFSGSSFISNSCNAHKNYIYLYYEAKSNSSQLHQPKRKADSLTMASAFDGVNPSATDGIHQNRMDGTIPKAKVKSKPAKKAAIDCIHTDFELHKANDNAEVFQQTKKKHNKGDSVADILTVFRPADPEDASEGCICEICK
jgi:hypothetical protein